MAKYVTREMDITMADVFYFDRAAMKVERSQMQFAGKLNEKDCEKQAQREMADYKVVEVSIVGYSKKLYGVIVGKFMECAVELDPATRKPLEE